MTNNEIKIECHNIRKEGRETLNDKRGLRLLTLAARNGIIHGMNAKQRLNACACALMPRNSKLAEKCLSLIR